MQIEIQRIYEEAERTRRKKKGFRIFVDRLWARGIKKEEAGIDMWLKDVAPSDKLRKWFGHDPSNWSEFKERYFEELDGKKESVELIVQKLRSGKSVLLLYGAKDEEFNNAVALRDYLLAKLTK
jgi:uncharacterized protein YeaO (DUF488 family)